MAAQLQMLFNSLRPRMVKWTRWSIILIRLDSTPRITHPLIPKSSFSPSNSNKMATHHNLHPWSCNSKAKTDLKGSKRSRDLWAKLPVPKTWRLLINWAVRVWATCTCRRSPLTRSEASALAETLQATFSKTVLILSSRRRSSAQTCSILQRCSSRMQQMAQSLIKVNSKHSSTNMLSLRSQGSR